MPRSPRLVLPGFPHHLTQRGNRKQDVFFDKEDREFFLALLSRYSSLHKVEIWSYCLMANHYHLIGQPHTRSGLSCCLHDLDGCYAGYFNRKYALTGHLWQDRFFGCVLDNTHLWNAVRYVERNCVEAGMVKRAEDYRWSSAAAHCGQRIDPVLTPNAGFPPPGLMADWSQWLRSEVPQQDLHRLREATRRGLPCGSDAFLRQLERMLGIRLRPPKRGRPPGPEQA
jgi:putative transposase